MYYFDGIMREEYDEGFWREYADSNESRYNEEFAKFASELVRGLRCTSVLEVGCGTGIDLRLMAEDTVTIHGVDLNEYALDIAKNKMSFANFKKGDITELPFEDSSIDFVFTHGLMNYLDDDTVKQGVGEMYRVANRFIMNCERFDATEKQIGEHSKFRNMQNSWLNYKVKIVSNVDMHEDIEPDKPRFTLVKKI